MEHATQVRILDQLLAMVESGTTVDAGVQLRNPTQVYTDPDLAQREWQTFFREHPQLVGLSGDLAQPGSYITLDDFGVPLIAMRDRAGRFRAFINACRHRGTRLTDTARGQAQRFVCPFHGWTYSADGTLVGVTEEKQFGAVDRDCNGLLELPTAEQYGLLWIHPQPAGVIDVEALLGGLAHEIQHWHLQDRIFRGARTLDKRMNWKLANDTFGETYHFARLHRNTLGQISNGEALAYEIFARNHRAVFPTRKLALLRAKPRERWRISAVTTVLYYLFPNVQMTVSDRQITLFRIYPDPQDSGRSRIQTSHYFSAEALALLATGEKTVIDDSNVYDPSRRDGNAIISPEAAMEIIHSTLENEDFRMAESTQTTVASGQVPHLIFGRNEAPLHHFHNTFRAALKLPPLEQSA